MAVSEKVSNGTGVAKAKCAKKRNRCGLGFYSPLLVGGATAKPDGVVAGDTARAKPRAIETISRLLIPPPCQPHRHDTRAAQQHPAQHIQRKMRPQKHPSQRVYADKTPDSQPAQHTGTR